MNMETVARAAYQQEEAAKQAQKAHDTAQREAERAAQRQYILAFFHEALGTSNGESVADALGIVPVPEEPRFPKGVTFSFAGHTVVIKMPDGGLPCALDIPTCSRFPSRWIKPEELADQLPVLLGELLERQESWRRDTAEHARRMATAAQEQAAEEARQAAEQAAAEAQIAAITSARVADAKRDLWVWPTGVALALSTVSWVTSHPGPETPAERDQGYSLQGRLDDAGCLTIEPGHVYHLIPAVHLPVFEILAIAATEDLPADLTEPVTVPLPRLCSDYDETSHLRYSVDEAPRYPNTLRVGIQPVPWVRAAVDALVPERSLLTGPELRPVTSSTIAAVGYDANRETLTIQFKSGAIYDYTGVIPAQYGDLMAADSLGSHFATHIKARPDRFPFTQRAVSYQAEGPA